MAIAVTYLLTPGSSRGTVLLGHLGGTPLPPLGKGLPLLVDRGEALPAFSPTPQRSDQPRGPGSPSEGWSTRPRSSRSPRQGPGPETAERRRRRPALTSTFTAGPLKFRLTLLSLVWETGTLITGPRGVGASRECTRDPHTSERVLLTQAAHVGVLLA